MTKITSAVVRELLDYDPETGIFKWKVRGEHWFKSKQAHYNCNARFAGKRAGTMSTNELGYQRRQILVAGTLVTEHRIAWLWMCDEPLPEAIDHINRDATDNRWCNLRASSWAENGLNKSKRRTSNSVAPGVSRHKATGKWRARCMVNKIDHHLGLFDSLVEAERASLEFRAKNGFDPSHGSDVAHYV